MPNGPVERNAGQWRGVMGRTAAKERKGSKKQEEPVRTDTSAHTIASVLILIVLTLAVYGHCAGFDFVHWDDHLHVYQNPYIAELTAANMRHLWSVPYEGLYIPLSYTAYALIAHEARMPRMDKAVTSVQTVIDPHPFHAVNVALHLVNALLVFALLRKLIAVSTNRPTATAVPALFGTLLFALHPLQVESVAWISELRGLLCSFFSLAALLAYIDAVADSTSPSPWQEDGSGGVPIARWTYWAALLLFALGGLCKPSTVALPIALAAIDRFAAGRSWRASIASAAPFLVVSTVFILKTHTAQPVPDRILVPWWTHPFVAADALAFYLAKLVVPYGLTIDYGRKPGIIAGNWWGYATWLAPAAVAYLVYRYRKTLPLAVAGGLISLSMLLPVLGLVPFVYQDYSTVADRYCYLAMLGPAIALASIMARIRAADLVRAYAAAGVVIAAYAVVTIVQVGRWQNSFTLFEYAVRMNPDGYQMRENYGIALKEAGRLSDAVDQFNESIRIEPGYSRVYNDLGLVLLQQGNVTDAISDFQLCVDREPGFADGHRDLGAAYEQTEQLDLAIAQYQQAVDIEPLEASCHNDYANALLEANRPADAAREYHAALAIDPAMPESLYGLSNALVATGDNVDAEASARQAIAIEPGAARAHGALARVLDSKGRLTDAVAEYRRAIACDPNDATMHYNLACAYFNHGDRNDAIPELQQAASLHPDPSYYDGLGMAYLMNGDNANARAAFQHELQLNPNSTAAKQQLAKLGG